MHRFLRVLPSLLLLFLAFTLASAPAHAKRSGPAKVEPVIHEGVKYAAPHEDGRRAIIRATDSATGKLLWEKEIFTVKIRPDLETDVQWVFIKSLSVENKRLIIVATNNRSYSLDLQTKEVLKLK